MRKSKPPRRTKPGPVVVTLVHGTFARKAAWTQMDSALSRALSAAGLQVSRFTWSGRNSFHARAHAARELADHLGRTAREHPGARQWVVAHSHGGNVALHAVERLRQQGQVSPVPVVTLATPFIHARTRASSGLFVGSAVLFGVLLLIEAGLAIATGGHSWFNRALIAAGGVFAVELALCIVGAVRHRDILGEGCGERLVDAIQAPVVSSRNLVAIRAVGDEASLGLASGQLLGWLGSLVASLFGRSTLWLLIIIAVQLSALLTAILGLGFSVAIIWCGGFGFFCLGGVITMLAASLTFGLDDGPFVALFASISAEATPPGEARAVQLEPFPSTGKLKLTHSRLYDEPEVIRRILQEIG
ncbi:triacylglycerol lipase [Streptomyces sp. PanSC9]|uniref:esterase/lipase family protein n=1 Tax=Streptomyces sp. PanSC9 TaxID=1520461 RepID=UPI000F498361|nr:hypothetical protein [Streptomyces sp. PanSC9]ROP44139.1 putative serine esterase DUF676 [Streptomyces sp. PanSC9]